VLDLELRALSKSTATQPQTIRSIDGNSVFVNQKPIEHWIRSIKSLHESKPPPSVQYSKRMPDIEDLMQVWPTEIEEFLKTV
jgi:intraflagellar transport protein 46